MCTQWENRLLSSDIATYTTADIELLCQRQLLSHSADAITQNKADGSRVSKVVHEVALMKLIGCTCFGDATYMLHTLQSIKKDRTLLPPRVLSTHAQPPADPRMWNVEQTCVWLESVQLPSLCPIFIKHRIAGTIYSARCLPCSTVCTEILSLRNCA
jgi:hypothetical protein